MKFTTLFILLFVAIPMTLLLGVAFFDDSKEELIIEVSTIQADTPTPEIQFIEDNDGEPLQVE